MRGTSVSVFAFTALRMMPSILAVGPNAARRKPADAAWKADSFSTSKVKPMSESASGLAGT